MNKSFFPLLAGTCSLLLSFAGAASAQQQESVSNPPFALLHGPYLQEVTTEAATVVYETSDKAFSWVEVKPH